MNPTQRPLIVVNEALPSEAMEALQGWGRVLPFGVPGLQPEPLRGHVDLFLSQWAEDELMVAPDMPFFYVQQLQAAGVPFRVGGTAVGMQCQGCGAYNVAVGPDMVIGHEQQVDSLLRQALEPRRFVHVRQGLARCSALVVGQGVVTSDAGIAKVLTRNCIPVLWVDPQPLRLPGYPHGCWGGCCGVWGQRVFTVGSLQHHPQGEEIRAFVQAHGYGVVELYPGPLVDVGSLFFLSMGHGEGQKVPKRQSPGAVVER